MEEIVLFNDNYNGEYKVFIREVLKAKVMNINPIYLSAILLRVGENNLKKHRKENSIFYVKDSNKNILMKFYFRNNILYLDHIISAASNTVVDCNNLYELRQ